MFKRFSEEAREVVVAARDHAVRLEDHHIGTEHLLLALLTAPSSVKGLLQDAGISAEAVESDRAAAERSKNGTALDRGALAALGIDVDFGLDAGSPESERTVSAQFENQVDPDRDALAVLGIDLDQVEAATDAVFGVGAFGQARRYRQKVRRARRQPRRSSLGPSDRLAFSPRSKNVLELSLRESLRLKHKVVGAEHLALGMLNEGEGRACRILLRHGITLEGLRTTVEDSLKRAA